MFTVYTCSQRDLKGFDRASAGGPNNRKPVIFCSQAVALITNDHPFGCGLAEEEETASVISRDLKQKQSVIFSTQSKQDELLKFRSSNTKV